MLAKVVAGNCTELLTAQAFAEHDLPRQVHLAFLDPPFNQGKDYEYFDDTIPESDYWEWMTQVCAKVHALTEDGGALYFMQREKNTEYVLRCLRQTGWTFQNLIVWMKRTSAVPGPRRFGKQYQIIAFGTKGPRARVFHRLRVDAPLRPGYRQARERGIFVTDCWDDTRELTSGYYAGDEALRQRNGERFHKQQAPVALLLRIILSSTDPGDVVLDPFAGTGTTLVVAEQLGRPSTGIEIDPRNAEMILSRLSETREADSVVPFHHYYRFSPNLDEIWPGSDARWGRKPGQAVLIT
jgi:DNA modification methylase